MKKFMFFAIALVMVCSAFAMADSIANDWQPAGDYNNIEMESSSEDAVGAFIFRESDSYLWEARGTFDPSWMYNANDTLSISVDGFNNAVFAQIRQMYPQYDFQTNPVGIKLTLLDENGEPASVGTANIQGGFFTNGTYEFVGDSVTLGDYSATVNWSDDLEGVEIGGLVFSLGDDDITWDMAFMTQTGISPKSLLTDGTLNISASVKTADEETVVPEPATYAYALMGLGSLMGIKRRIKK